MTTAESAATLAVGAPDADELVEARAVVEAVATTVETVISGKPEAVRLALVALLA